jgi:hypothetical protein
MRSCVAAALLLGLGAARAVQAEPKAACAPLLRAAHGQARLPGACRILGPLRLGADESVVRRLYGAPDAAVVGADGGRTAAWVFPRDLGRRLAARPVRAGALSYGVLYVRSRTGRITGLRDETGGLATELAFAGVKPGDPVARADAALGAPSSVSRARDFRSYAPLPLAVHADEDRRTVNGFEIGDSAGDLGGPEAQGRPTTDGAGRVRALALRFPNAR